MSLFWFWKWRRYWNLPLHESKHVRSAKPTIWNRPEISYCALDDVEEMRRKSALTYRLQINPTIGQSWIKSFGGSQLLWPENKIKNGWLLKILFWYLRIDATSARSKYSVIQSLRLHECWKLRAQCQFRMPPEQKMTHEKWRTVFHSQPARNMSPPSSQWRVVCEFWSIKVGSVLLGSVVAFRTSQRHFQYIDLCGQMLVWVCSCVCGVCVKNSP